MDETRRVDPASPVARLAGSIALLVVMLTTAIAQGSAESSDPPSNRLAPRVAAPPHPLDVP